jgi:translocation and assembly module TamA
MAADMKYKVVGVEGKAQENVLAILKTKNTNLTNLQKIRTALEPFGYFHSTIKSRLAYDPDTREKMIIYYIQPGPRVKIVSLKISLIGEGKDNPAINKYIARFPIKVHQWFNTVDYNAAKDRLFTIAANQGYLNARFNNQLKISTRSNQARIVILLDTGHRYYIGAITYGVTAYSKNFMDRVVRLQPGEVYSPAKIRKLQRDMENSYYFSEVNISPSLTDLDADTVPLVINTHTDTSSSYKLGVGYGATSGERVLAGLSMRHLNDEGHHFEAQLSVSQILSGFTANYYVPGNNPLTDTWVYSANYNLFLPRVGKSHVVKFSGGYETKTAKTQLTINLNALIERFYISQTTWQTSHLIYPQLNYNYLNIDDKLNPKQAFNVNLNLSGTAQAFASSTSYLQIDLKIKGLYALGNVGRLIWRGELGATAVHNLPVYPLSMRFFAGGLGSIRGYPDSYIGPGKYLQVGSIEYQQKLRGSLYAGAFYDIGRAGNHINNRFFKSVGVGLIYGTPIGPIKLYVAKPISSSRKPGIVFSIGPEFA